MSKKEKLEKYRSKTYCLLLYPEDATHLVAIDKIRKSYDYAMILHNKDIEIDGTLKKEHYHIVLRFDNAVWNTALAKDLGIAENYIQDTRKFDRALLYLIHYNDTNKAQYTIEEVEGSLINRLKEIINKAEKSEGEKVYELFKYIESCDYILSTKEFGKWCAENGYWAEYRRGASIFHRVIDEHNFKISRNIQERSS